MRKVLENNVGLIIYLAVWAALFCWFWLGLKALYNHEMIYSLGAFYVFLPVSALVVSVMYGAGNSRIRFVIPVILGILEMLLEFITFDLANVMSNGKWNSWNGPDWTLCQFSLLPALVGLAIGVIFKRIRRSNGGSKG